MNIIKLIIILALINISVFTLEIYFSKFFGKDLKKWWNKNICKDIDQDFNDF